MSFDPTADPDAAVRDNGSAQRAISWPSAPHLPVDWTLVEHEVRRTTHGGAGSFGVFATVDIAAGAVAVVFGGFVTPGALFRHLDASRRQHSLQVGDDLYLVGGETLSSADLINHSCEPTLGFAGEITLVARRDISSGEQLTFDYATCDSEPYDEFECECGTASCRTKVTGEDWLMPEVQERYRGFFSPYLQRRIDALPH